MANWLLRGLVYAAAMVVVRLIQGVLINTFESKSGLISVTLLLIFVIAVMAWGLLDGRSDATANPDPDRRQDLAMMWLAAGLAAGAIGGAAAWLISLVDKALYVGSLVNEVTTLAAFTALLVFVPAMAAVATGRWQVDRQYAKVPVRHHGLAAHDEGQADTDVFAAVGAGAGSAAAAGDATLASPTSPGLSQPAGWTAEEFPVEADETTESPADNDDR